MERHEVTKEVEYGGRRWVIGKLDAWTASFVAYQLGSRSLPGGMGAAIGLSADSNGEQLMSKSEFRALQSDLLSAVSELLPAGATPVLDRAGNFAVRGLEQDGATLVLLTLASLRFNVSDFFDQGFLERLSGILRDMIPSAAPLSASSSSPQ